MKNELANTQPQASTVDLIRAVIDSGITAESVSVVERLVALKEREQATFAEREFASAFAKLQADMPRIEACKGVPNRDGSIRYSYAPFADIMEQARPVLTASGFAITFDTEVIESRIFVTCTLMHQGGHSRSNKFGCRIGGGPGGCSEAQADGAAMTYAKRFALCAALNIVIDQADPDGADASEKITQQQADSLKGRCIDSNSDIVRFLKFLKVEHFEDILAKDFAKADKALRMKEGQK